MIKTLLAACLLSSSIGAKSIPQKRVYTPNLNNTQIQGIYNYRDTWDWSGFNAYCQENGIYSIEDTYHVDHISSGGMPVDRYIAPCSIDNKTYFAYDLDFSYFIFDSLTINIKYYYAQDIDSEFGITIESGDSLSDFTQSAREFIIEFNDTFQLDSQLYLLWDFVFTKDDNAYVTTYNGYFNISGSITRYSADYPFTVFGSFIYNNNLYWDIRSNPNESEYYDYLDFGLFDVTNSDYMSSQGITLPISLTDRNILFSGAKMSLTSRNNLNRIGVFNYIADHTFDDATFEDLLFSIMDSPIYMLSRLLSFELFGLRLYIALIGLLTVCAILVLIRKFF